MKLSSDSFRHNSQVCTVWSFAWSSDRSLVVVFVCSLWEEINYRNRSGSRSVGSLSVKQFGEAIPTRGGELIAISVLKVLEFFFNSHATILFWNFLCVSFISELSHKFSRSLEFWPGSQLGCFNLRVVSTSVNWIFIYSPIYCIRHALLGVYLILLCPFYCCCLLCP
jgi:hypothetical protein